ncbi:hypothetical protein ACS0TY_019340 [Phlomoides rotata]
MVSIRSIIGSSKDSSPHRQTSDNKRTRFHLHSRLLSQRTLHTKSRDSCCNVPCEEEDKATQSGAHPRSAEALFYSMTRIFRKSSASPRSRQPPVHHATLTATAGSRHVALTATAGTPLHAAVVRQPPHSRQPPVHHSCTSGLTRVSPRSAHSFRFIHLEQSKDGLELPPSRAPVSTSNPPKNGKQWLRGQLCDHFDTFIDEDKVVVEPR